MLNTSSLKPYAYETNLDGSHNDVAVRLLTLRVCDDPLILT